MAGQNKGKTRCPHCGHCEMVTVLRLTTNNCIKKSTIVKIKRDWPLIFFKTTCRECHKTVTNKAFCCKDGRFSKYDQRMEIQFYFDGLLVGDSLPLDLLSDHGKVSYHWKCKQCRGTWSEISGAGDWEVCPLCGMRSLIRIVYGEPSDEYSEAAERNEVRLGGPLDDPDNPSWVCLECDNHE